MRLLSVLSMLLILTATKGEGVGKAWRVSQYPRSDYASDHSSWPRLDSSAFEVRTISGVGRLASSNENPEDKTLNPTKASFEESNGLSTNLTNSRDQRESKEFPSSFQGSTRSFGNPYGFDNFQNTPMQKIFKTKLMMRLLALDNDDSPENVNTQTKPLTYDPYANFDRIPEQFTKINSRVRREDTAETGGISTTILPDRLTEHNKDSKDKDFPESLNSRLRRDSQNETRMEQISTIKNTREARLAGSESWQAQPISVEFRHRTNYDQVMQPEDENDQAPLAYRNYHPPRADFVTSHRRNYDNREARGMSGSRSYAHHDQDYEMPWYRNTIRERDYDIPAYRYGYGNSYRYPDVGRYRTERDYYVRTPGEPYFYDRYREEELDLYGRRRPTPKPKRIIYYATLPEVVRKPVDLRNYPRPYDGVVRASGSRDSSYKRRIPGNVDPGRYRYRHLYDPGYDSYSKRSSYYDRPYGTYQDDDEGRKVPLKENPRDFDSQDRKANQVRDEGGAKLPWPVQIGTEVSVKDDERIPGRKIFGETNGYERFQSAQLQKAQDATGSSELRDDH